MVRNLSQNEPKSVSKNLSKSDPSLTMEFQRDPNKIVILEPKLTVEKNSYFESCPDMNKNKKRKFKKQLQPAKFKQRINLCSNYQQKLLKMIYQQRKNVCMEICNINQISYQART